jgi:hypothetical protein
LVINAPSTPATAATEKASTKSEMLILRTPFGVRLSEPRLAALFALR